MKNGNKMRVVIVGCGLIGKKRAKSLGDAKLVACCDTDKKKALDFSVCHENIPYFISIHDLLEEVEFDIIILSTTHNSLPELINIGIENNKHILVEKPAARFSYELEGFYEKAEKKNCKVRIGFNHRYHRALVKAKEIISSGQLGELMFIRGRYGHGGRLGYEKEWRAKPSVSGGGELIDQGSHLIDLSRMFLGDFVKVDGFACNYFWKMPVDDNAFLSLRNKKGNTAFLQVSCTEWKNTFSFEIYGRKGKIEIDGLGGSYGTEKIIYYKMLTEMGPPETYSWEFPMKDNSWEIEFKEFVKDILDDRKPIPGIKDAIENLKIINKIYKQSGYDYNS